MRYLSILAILFLAACGGGGGGGGGSGSPGAVALNGQVVKGLTSGATVSLYSVSGTGTRTFVVSGITNAQGAFNLSAVLQAGQVYVLEAVGGQYVNEITGVTETLSAPIRGVFVATGSETQVAISPLSEAVAIDVEQSALASKWTASAITAASDRIADKLGIPSGTSFRYVDLPTLAPGSNPDLSTNDIAFSLQAGIFAGFWQEMRLRHVGYTLSQAIQSFRTAIVEQVDGSEGNSALFAGVVRFLEKVPALNNTSVFTKLGLPFGTNSGAFTGSESTGQTTAPVPNQTLRYLSPMPMASQSTTDTFFNSRGALIAWQQFDRNSGLGLMHVGVSSVADVFGDAEIAIGRWNKGYYYPRNVTYDSASATFNTNNAVLTPLSIDFVYATGVPATNLPTCAIITMAPQAQTKALRTFDNTRSLTVEASSRIVFLHAAGQTRAGFTLVMRDDLGNLYSMNSTGGAADPSQGAVVPQNMEFDGALVPIPSGETLRFRGLLAGNGATKAVIHVNSNIGGITDGLAAAFAVEGSPRPCPP